MANWSNNANPNPNVLNSTNSWGGNPETKQKPTTRIDIAEALQIASDPSNAPLNHIENLKKWREILDSYKEEVRQKQKQLLVALKMEDDTNSELNKYRDEKISLDLALHEIEWTLWRKLSGYVSFVDEIYEQVKDLFKYQVTSDGDEGDGKYQIPMDMHPDLENNRVILVTKKELTDNEKIQVCQSALSHLQEQGVDITDMSVEYMVQQDAIDRYLELVNPDNFVDVLKRLKYSDKIKLKKIEKELKETVDSYFELCNQINILSQEIDDKETDYYNMSSVSDGIQDEIDDMATNIEQEGKTYFLNSYLSTKNVPLNSFVSSPLVEKQIANIIEANKRWLTVPKTILLYWKSNTWKSYAANVLATELWRKMYHIRSYDLFEWWYSDPNEMLDSVFTTAVEKAEPCIIFLDEIEKFAWWDEWSYRELLENTIRHHVSKIKESSLDIMIIWAISNRNKVSQSLLKQDVFSYQIYFSPLQAKQYEDLFEKMTLSKMVKIWEDIVVPDLISKIKATDLDQEYLTKLIDLAIEFHKLNNSWDWSDIILSAKDFDDAISYMSEYVQKVWSNSLWFNSKQ